MRSLALAFLAGLTCGVGFYEVAGWCVRRRTRQRGHPVLRVGFLHGRLVLLCDRKLSQSEREQLQEKWSSAHAGVKFR